MIINHDGSDILVRLTPDEQATLKLAIESAPEDMVCDHEADFLDDLWSAL